MGKQRMALCLTIFDLTKAYNTLPRIPVMGIASWVGIDFDVL